MKVLDHLALFRCLALARGLVVGLAAMACLAIGRPGVASPGDPDWIFASGDERRLVEAVQALSNRNEYDEAVPLAREAVRRFPDSPQSNLARVYLAQAMNRLEDALPYYAGRISQNPKDGVAHLSLGICYLQVNNVGAAERELKEALSLLPDRVEVRHFQVLLARADVNKRKDARSLTERMRRDFPDYARALISDIRYRMSEEESTRSIQPLLDAALALPVPPPDAFALQDELNQRELWYDQASGVRLFDKALSIDPSRVDLGVDRAYRLLQIGRSQDALEAFNRIIGNAPRSGDARIALARTLIDLHRYDEALRVVEAGVPVARYQDWYPSMALRISADAYHMSGRDAQAIEALQTLLREDPTWRKAFEARRFLLTLLGRSPNEAVHVLDNVPFLTQKGNYCGPATLSMDLGYWGVELSQDAIATDIYTGVVGTAPQVVKEYALTKGYRAVPFEGDVDSWKRVLDAGIPVLWLMRLPRGSGHYILIAGYDDVMQEFIVHNPHQATERRVSYEELKNSSSYLPHLIWSIAVVPEGRASDPVLRGLRQTVRLGVVNWVFYIATGSNLFKGIWPALGVNVGVAGVLALVVLGLMRALAYPGFGRSGWVFFLAAVGLVALLNPIIAMARVSSAVSILLAYYLACLSLIPLFGICWVLRWFSHDWFHPKELLGLSVVVFGSWALRGLIDDGYWQDRVAVLVVVAGFVAVLGIRWGMGRAILRARLGPHGGESGDGVGLASSDGKGGAVRLPKPERLLARYAGRGPGFSGYYAALVALAETRQGNLDGKGTRALLERMRQNRNRWPRRSIQTFDLFWAVSFIFDRYVKVLKAGDGMGDGKASEKDRSGSSAIATMAGPLKSNSAPASWDDAVGILERLLRECGDKSPTGAVAAGMLALAYALSGDGEAGAGDGVVTRERILDMAWKTNAYLSSRSSWPRLPGIPAVGFHSFPHLLVRLLPVVIGQAAGSNGFHASLGPVSTAAERIFDTRPGDRVVRTQTVVK